MDHYGITGDVICQLCGEEFEQITNWHLFWKHGKMSLENYENEFPDAPLQSAALIEKRIKPLRGVTRPPETVEAATKGVQEFYSSEEGIKNHQDRVPARVESLIRYWSSTEGLRRRGL